jgi:hypothetical protein
MSFRTMRPLILLLGLGACTDALLEPTTSDSVSDLTEYRGEPADAIVQTGTGFIPMAITQDDYVLYQDGSTLYATALAPKATRQAVAEIPNGNTAFVYTSGLVAFIWTDPDFTSPSFGVSPLVIWTSRYGAHLASDASAVGTLATVASRDGRHVVFPTHASAGGVVGDLVAATSDLRHVTPLVTGIQTDFSNGPCRPLGVFLEDAGDAYPAIAYCPGADTTSTISIFRRGGRRDVTGLVDPPQLFVDADAKRLLTVRASADNPQRGNPVLITEHDVTTIEDVSTRTAFFTPDGSALYFHRAATGVVTTRRARFRRGRITIDEVTPSIRLLIGNGFGSNALSHAITSRDGRWLAYSAVSDPATGLGNVTVVDLHAAAPASAILTLDDSLDNVGGTNEEPFTQDGAFAIYAKVDVTLGAQQFYAASTATGERQPLGELSGFSALPAVGSFVAFNDNVVFDPTNFSRSTADVKLVNPADPEAAPRLLAAAANAQVFLDRRKRRVIYATNAPGQAGLHVARVQ